VATGWLLMGASIALPPGVYGRGVELLEYVLAGLGVGVVLRDVRRGRIVGFAAGLIPGAAVGARLAQRISAARLRAAFGGSRSSSSFANSDERGTRSTLPRGRTEVAMNDHGGDSSESCERS
ncbi:MAG: hypothetical protein ACXW2C_12595, partial [Acidimicrobiia bacterium]